MNYTSKLTAAVLLSIAAMGGIANAGSTNTVKIFRVDQIANDATKDAIRNHSSAEIKATQANMDRALANELRARNVNLKNVLQIDTFANGTINVYVR